MGVGVGIILIIIFVSVCLVIRYFVRKAVFTASDKIQDSIQNSLAQRKEENNPPQRQSLAERYSGMPIQKEKTIASNEWMCVRCGRTNPKLVGTCGCGCTQDESIRIQKEKEAKEQKEKEERKRMIEMREEEEQIERNKKGEILLAKKGIESLNEQEWMAIRMIEKSSNQRMPMQEMMRMLPRSADFNSFKVAVNHLEELGLIRQDSEGSYYICDEEKV